MGEVSEQSDMMDELAHDGKDVPAVDKGPGEPVRVGWGEPGVAQHVYVGAPTYFQAPSTREMALAYAERHAVDENGRRLSGKGVLKLAKQVLKFLEAGE